MPIVEPGMNPEQLASLVDAAWRSPNPLTFLDTVVMTLKTLGRHADGTTVAWIGCLHAEGEVEILMALRAAWRRGEERSPAEASRSRMRCHRQEASKEG